MADATDLQTDFRGGEWSPYAQGRADDKDYRRGMSVCRNGYPTEEGAWIRRQGFRFAATTRYGQPGWLLDFAFAQQSPYTMEFTNQMLRLFNGPNLVSTNDPQTVVSVSTANPAKVKTNTAHGWSSGSQVQFLFPTGTSYPLAYPLMNRQFLITVTSTTEFTIADPITGLGIDGSTLTLPGFVSQVARVLEIASPYTQTQLSGINKVQAEGTVVTLLNSVAPQSLVQVTAPSASAFATFSYGAATFIDGPYMDPNTTGTLTPGATTGTTTFSGAPANTFVATDVGRLLRLFSEPAAYLPAHAYSTNDIVKYGSLYYIALAGSTGKQPDVNPTSWGATTTAAIWTWAKITTYTSGTQVSATIMGADLLYTTPINSFRLGLYSDTTGYPTNGVYHEGRLWLAGAQGNRFDASNSNDNPFDMTPTAPDGTVGDSNAISYVLNAEDVNQILWMLPDNGGIVAGTAGGEWMIAASNLQDPLTPTSVQAHRRSKYKCANVQAVNAGVSILFVQKKARKVMEYVADTFSGKFLGRNLSEKAKHLTNTSIAQIAYQQELAPILWARTGGGALIGTTYKRESSFTSEPPTINGWHRHDLGSGRLVESIAVGPSVHGDLDSLTAITNDPVTGIRHVEIMTDMFDETSTINDAWFLDDAVTPIAAVENLAASTVQFFGMLYLVGKTVSVWAGGLDLGDFTVAADGSVTVPINAAGSLFTDAYLTTLTNSGENFDDLAVYINRTVNVQYPVGSGNLIQSYLMTLTPDGFMDDYVNNQVYAVERGSGASCGIAIFNRLTGVKKLERTGTSIFAAGSGLGIDPGASGPLVIGGDGYLYFNGTNANTVALVKINAKTLDFVQAFGAAGGNSNTNTTMIHMNDGVVVNARGNYLVMVGNAFADLGVYNVDQMQFAGHTFPLDEGNNTGVCPGPVINLPHNRGSFATTYVVAVKSDGTQIGFYKTAIDGNAAFGYNNPISTTGGGATAANPGITTTKIATILPASIDALWTTISAISGPIYDPNDGNVIIFASSALAVATEYAVKLNAATGAVIWATAVAWDGQALPYGFNNTKYITNGLLSYLTTSTTSTLHTIATSSGSIVDTTTLASISAHYSSCVDHDGSIISYGTWSGATLTGVNGTVAFSTNVFKIQGFSGFPGNTTESQEATIPVVIGFTYTSQGSTLRDIAPDATGARNGPALGKTRRNHRFSVLVANTQGISFGCALDQTLHKAKFLSRSGKGVTPLLANQLYSGVYSDTIESDYNYDDSPSWQITRPYPAAVASVQGFLSTQDR